MLHMTSLGMRLTGLLSWCHRQQVEYKYIVKAGNGSNTPLREWQPGQNRAVKVPAETGLKLQVLDDWRGQSRSVVHNDGKVGTPPTGTFNGPPPHTAKESSSHESSVPGAKQPASGGFQGTRRPAAHPPDIQECPDCLTPPHVSRQFASTLQLGCPVS